MKKFDKYIGYSFIINLLLGIIVVGVTFWLGDGVFYLGGDFNLQQVPFNQLARQSIEAGEFYWLDNFDLGTGFINALSFYVIGSPFFWITFLIPNPDYSIIVPCMLVAKFAVAGTGAYCYIKQYVKNFNWALIASMFYAFSGYQLTNLNYNHFHDVTALFPFLLLALDKAVNDDKKGYFCVMVALMALTSYFFFVAVVVFLVIYFAIKLLTREFKLNKKLFFSLATESILGVGISAILLLPSFFAIIENPRVSDTIFYKSNLLFLQPYQYADLIRAMIIPAENIFKRGIILELNSTAAEIYLPVIGMIPVFAYVLNHKKDWMSILSFVCFVFMLNPVLNSTFTAFNAEYYPRWFFMPILIFSAMAAKHYDNNDGIKPAMKIWLFLVVLFFSNSIIWKYYFKAEYWPNKLQATVMIAIAFAGVCIVVFVDKFKNNKFVIPLMICAVFIQTTAVFFIGSYYTHKYWNQGYGDAGTFFKEVSKMEYPDEEEYYRTVTKDAYMNAGIYSDKPSINTFATNISGSIFEFYHSNFIPRTVNSVISEYEYGFYTFLGVKYIIKEEGDNISARDFTTDPVWSDSGYAFYENKNFAGMGFTYDNAITKEEHEKLSVEVRHLASIDAIVLDDEQIEKYGHMYNFKTADEYIHFSYDDFSNVAAEKRLVSPQNYSEKNGVYTFDVSLDETTIYYISIPYSKGFTAKVNKQNTDIMNINNGFIGLVLPEGDSTVEIIYYPPGLKLGIAVSGISLILFAGYLSIAKFYKKKKIG